MVGYIRRQHDRTKGTHPMLTANWLARPNVSATGLMAASVDALPLLYKLMELCYAGWKL